MYGVLIIEDDPQVAQMTADFLTQNGYSVAGIAGGAEQALEYLRRERIQLILLDILQAGDGRCRPVIVYQGSNRTFNYSLADYTRFL